MERFTFNDVGEKIEFMRDLIKIYKEDVDKLVKILNISKSEINDIVNKRLPLIVPCAYENLTLYTQSEEFKDDECLKNNLEIMYNNFYKTLNLLNLYENNINCYMEKQFTYINKKINKIIYNDYNYDIDKLYKLKGTISEMIENEKNRGNICTLSTRSYCNFTYNTGKTRKYTINSKTFHNFIGEMDQATRNKIYSLDISYMTIDNEILNELLEDGFIRKNLPNCCKFNLSNNSLNPSSELTDLLNNFVMTFSEKYKPEIFIYKNKPNLKNYRQGLDDCKLRYCIRC